MIHNLKWILAIIILVTSNFIKGSHDVIDIFYFIENRGDFEKADAIHDVFIKEMRSMLVDEEQLNSYEKYCKKANNIHNIKKYIIYTLGCPYVFNIKLSDIKKIKKTQKIAQSKTKDSEKYISKIVTSSSLKTFKLGSPLYRADSRSPREIIEAGGFKILSLSTYYGPISLIELKKDYQNDKYLVSTSKHFASATYHALAIEARFVYEIWPSSHNLIDFYSTYKHHNLRYKYNFQYEVASLLKIPIYDIRSSYDILTGNLYKSQEFRNFDDTSYLR